MRVCIVIPVYKYFKDLDNNERNSYYQCLNILYKRINDIYVIGGNNEILKSYQEVNNQLFDNIYFNSIRAYNSLCLRNEFYKRFFDLKYDYMLIYQLDAWIFEDKIDYFINEGYDFYGAPWFKGFGQYDTNEIIGAGNGGFSLRNIKRLMDICFLYKVPKEINEDGFFAIYCAKNHLLLNYPSQKALYFSFECFPEKCYEYTNHILPMGCHKYIYYNKKFWSSFINVI